ncbi:MAG: hypothetical protein Tsb0013_00320 [Phycisphaerales bacterium]
MPRLVRTIALLAALLPLTGCVTEERGPSSSTGERRPATLPEGYTLSGPIARPALTATRVNASVRAVIEPLGQVPYDGLVLPLVSPDGRLLATQTGSPPTWGTTLATPDAGPALRTRIEVYDISAAPPRRVALPTPIEAGVLLGRAANDRGFLVEEPRPDGSRRVGLCAWQTGIIDWLADEPGVIFTGATVTDDDELIATRRTVGEPDGALWSSRLGVLARDEGAVYAFPMLTGEPGACAAIELARDRGATLTWWTYRSGQPILRTRRRLTGDDAMITAYQSTDPLRGIAPRADTPTPGVLVFSPGAGRVVMFDHERADLVPLADRSFGGAWAPDEGGWAVLLSTPDGLVHQRLVSRQRVWEALPGADVLADPYIPRVTRNPDRPFVLIGPAPDDATRRLSIVGLDLLFGDERR